MMKLSPLPGGMDILRIQAFTYTYPGVSVPSLEEVSCVVRGGECLCLTGTSGCGKTTLLLAIKGLLRSGSRSGTIDIAAPSDEEGRSAPVGIVFQNAESQILCATVAEEVAFGPENLCVPPVEIALRIRKALRSVGLGNCEARNVERFSAGQKQRLAIASVLTMNPSLLLIDEPTSQLDIRGKRALCAILADLKRQGVTIVMAEHDPRPFASIVDRYLVMDGGRIVGESMVRPEPSGPAHRSSPPRRATEAKEEPATIVVEGLCLAYPETGAALTDVALRVRRAERVHLFGRNGAGKSSLLRCLAGLESPGAGTIEVAGIGAPSPENMPGNVGFLFQNPTRQLFAESVRDEVAFTLGRVGFDRPETGRVVEETLAFCGIGHLAERAPLTLSFGEQHRVALAAVIAPRPPVLLLDEPFAGLDIPQRLALLAILAKMPERYGTTVLIASHDELPDARWADRTLQLDGGILGETTREIPGAKVPRHR
jgi:energy-coupling factor transporter ATP-binding protein EcfA2